MEFNCNKYWTKERVDFVRDDSYLTTYVSSANIRRANLILQDIIENCFLPCEIIKKSGMNPMNVSYEMTNGQIFSTCSASDYSRGLRINRLLYTEDVHKDILYKVLYLCIPFERINKPVSVKIIDNGCWKIDSYDI